MALTKKEREKLFIEQRTAELTAAGKPVNTAALSARFAELGATPEGRQQITAKVQLSQGSAPAPAAPADAVYGGGVDVGASTGSFIDLGPLDKALQGMQQDPTFWEFIGQTQPNEFKPGGSNGVPLKPKPGAGNGGGGAGNGGGGGESTGSTGDKDALATINAMLSKYGLGSLAGQLWNMHLNKEVNITNEDAIAYVLKDTPAWQERFAGNIGRKASGYAELSPSTYIAMEETYKRVLKVNDMPAGFYDNQEALNKLIAGDIDAKEFNDRIGYARSIVYDAPASVKAQMQELYGISEGMLVAHFIDPKQADPLLKEQERTARIGAASLERAGMQLTREQATDLAKRGYTEEQAKAGFSDVAALGELKQTLAGEESVTQNEMIGASFGYNTDAQNKLRKNQRRRVAEFEGGGSFAKSQGIGGSIKSGVGGPE